MPYSCNNDPIRILVIDDNRAIHADFRKILSPANGSNELERMAAALFGEERNDQTRVQYEIDSAYQGEEGEEMVASAVRDRRPYLLAFVDMRMPPGWDGVTTIEHLWQIDPQLQVVICTAYSDYTWSQIIERLGQTDRLLILKKPFDNIEVSQLAAALSKKRRLEQTARLKLGELEELVDQRTTSLREELAVRKQTEQTLRVRDQQLQHKQRLEAIGSLASGVAHEFNNLLQVIIGYTAFAMDEAPEESAIREDLEQARTAARRAAEITGELLAFSRRDTPERNPLDVNALVRDQAKLLQPLIGETIEIEISTEDNVGAVLANRTVLGQLLINLCVNARDAMPEGGKLTITTRSVVVGDRRARADNSQPNVLPGRYVMVSVGDTGCGMSEEVQQRIFDPFFTTKEVGQGTGMGLAMVYSAVEQHEGAICVTSEPGQGTRFDIYFPLAPAELGPIDATEDGHVPAVPATEMVLVAEDDAQVRGVTVRTLERAGYTVLAAEDGEQAVHLFQQHANRIAMVLLDVVMPRMGGRQASDKIQAIRPDVGILFCTGYDPTMGNAVPRPEDGPVVRKPYDSATLLNAVRRQLDANNSLHEAAVAL